MPKHGLQEVGILIIERVRPEMCCQAPAALVARARLKASLDNTVYYT